MVGILKYSYTIVTEKHIATVIFWRLILHSYNIMKFTIISDFSPKILYYFKIDFWILNFIPDTSGTVWCKLVTEKVT